MSIEWWEKYGKHGWESYEEFLDYEFGYEYTYNENGDADLAPGYEDVLEAAAYSFRSAISDPRTRESAIPSYIAAYNHMCEAIAHLQTANAISEGAGTNPKDIFRTKRRCVNICMGLTERKKNERRTP